MTLPIAATMLLAVDAAAHDPVDYVDPMIGAMTTVPGDAGGKTFPGAATPFGMVQLSPDTVTGGDNGSGYSADMSTIEGFSFLHMSGVGWYGEFGNLQVMPEVGDLIVDRVDARSPYRKENETAKAGYYSVLLDRYDVKTELTAAPRAGMIRLTFPDSPTSRIKVDLARRIGGDGSHSTEQYCRRVDDHTVEGWIKCDPSGGGWGNGAGGVSYTVYFVLKIGVAIRSFGTWDGADISRMRDERTGKRSGFFLEFPTRDDSPVLVKAGISFASLNGARANLDHDIPGWDFDAVREAAHRQWSKALGAIDVHGSDDAHKTAFYTSLYHAMIDPRSITDIDGSYLAPDKTVRKAGGWTPRTCFSGWDVFRAEFPLLCMIEPGVVRDQINTLMEINEMGACKGLPRWELMGRDTPIMLGDPAVNVISEAYLKGVRGFDAQKAYAMCLGVAEGPADKSNREDFDHWSTLGYCTGGLSVSNTLENSYTDYALGRFADALGKPDDARRLFRTALSYRNVFDPSVGWFRGREVDGTWQAWTDRQNSNGCVESNLEQQGWFVPQDVAGLIYLVGGRAQFVDQLDNLFQKTPPEQIKGWNNWYNHSNEPVHQCAFLFTYAGAPWLTQKWSRYICENAYGTGPRGLCGNDDVGQMSAWYVLASIGLYPASPASNVFIIGSPIFSRAAVKIGEGRRRTFTVDARDASADNIYVQSASLDGKPLNRAWLTYDEIARGGVLELQMGPEPNKTWGSDRALAPPSLSD